MRLAFRQGRDVAELAVILEAGRRAGLDVGVLERAIATPRLETALREATDDALAHGVFGVPTVAVVAELFWGDDQLEHAARAASAVRARPGQPPHQPWV